MAITAHAIKIESDDGNGDLVNYTNSTLGFEDGIAYLITGRNGLDGSKTIAGDTDRDTWYEGILTKDFAPSPSRTADFTEAGCVTANSTLQFSVVEKNSFRSTLATNGIYLNRCRVTYYYVESSDGETFTFYQMWTGVIDDQPFTEVRNQANCIDNSKDIFTSVPTSVVDRVQFPNAMGDVLDKMIPIAIGRCALSPMVNIGGSGLKETLCVISGVEHAICAVKAFVEVSKTMDLFTQGVTFSADDSRLVGKYLTVVKGESEQSLKILSNDATDISDDTTTVTLEEWWETGTPIAWDMSIDDATVWYFEVRNYPVENIVSNKTISEFINNSLGVPAVYSYNSDAKTLIDVSEATLLQSLSNIASTGYPGIKILSTVTNSEGLIKIYIPIVPADIVVSLATNYQIDGGAITVGDSCPNLCDRDPDSYHDFQATTGTPSGGTNLLDLEVVLPENPIIKVVSDLYILFDYEHRDVTTPNAFGYSQRILPIVKDIYSREIEKTLVTFNGTTIGTSFVGANYLPGAYYNETRDDADFFDNKDNFSIGSEIDNIKNVSAYNTLIWGFGNPNTTSTSQYILRLKEIGLVGVAEINITRETLYASVIGETFGTEWQSPNPGSASDARTPLRTTTDPILHIGDAMEHLIRNYDYSHPVWQAGRAYVVGHRVRSTVDNGWIYICTVAGTSHASVEPTFPTTLDSTVTDGTVTWKALDTLKIHCGSFDTLATQRADWFVGRSIRDKKPSIDYYKEMARQGFFILLTDAQGRAKVKAWRENTAGLTTFDSSNIIQGSLGPVTPTPSRKCHNDFLIRYDENPATGGFNKQVGITRVDEPEFPGQYDTMLPGASLGTFEIGLIDLGGGEYRFDVITDNPNTLQTGDYVSLSGNADGYDFPPTQVSVKDTVQFFLPGHLTSGALSTSGTLRYHADSRLKWKSFAPGIQNYALAQLLWEQARRGYVVTKTVNKLPQDIGDCRWFPDPEATTPGGSRIWPDLAGGDDHPAVYLLQNLVEWCPLPKEQVTFEVGHSAARVTVSAEGVTRYLEEGDCVIVNDAKLTGGSAKTGWIHEFTLLPGDDRRPDRIRIGVTLNPDTLEEIDLIDENGADAADIIDENGAAAGDIIDEN